MQFWGKFRGTLWVIGIGAIFMLAGLIIGSNISIPGKLKAESSPNQGEGSSADIVKEMMPAVGHSPFVFVAESVRPAVVNISAESMTEDNFHSFMDDDFFRRFFGIPPGNGGKPQPRMRKEESLGSGFIISPDGYIMTNNHVVEGAEKVTVTLSDEHKYKAEVVGADKESDIALLKIDADHKLPTLSLGDSDSILVGDWVMAVGNPFPQLGLDRTVTVGVVSAKGRKGLSFGEENPAYQNYIQTDASINPGNSGGPLVNLKGEAIGVNSAIASPSGGNVGIGFAIPINMAKQVAEQLKKSGVVSRGYLGIFPQDITEDLKEANSLPSTEGILVAQVDKNTPAEKAGLKVGDVITRFNNEKVKDAQQFRFLVADAGPGAEIKVDLWRNGSEKNVSIKLGDRAQFVTATRQTKEGTEKEQGWLGIEVETPTEANTQDFGIKPIPGALIVSIEAASPADDAGLAVGDIILKVAGKDIESADDFHKVAREMKDYSKPISFYISRGGQTIFVAVTPVG